ncbi:MAG: ACT domain-containing protein [Ruminococcaceae bacterium]|nr:ACT domain-containing protein [Oscillospiraceae bacterium]
MYDIQAIQRDDGVAIVYIRKPPNIPGLAYRTFASLADNGIDVDLIVQPSFSSAGGTMIFTIHQKDAEPARDVLTELFAAHPETEIEIDPCAVKLSVAGEGMQGKPGVAARVFKCLWDAGVRIINISTSEIKISMLIPQTDADKAYDALVSGFEI